MERDKIFILDVIHVDISRWNRPNFLLRELREAFNYATVTHYLELELETEDESFERPAWLGAEVTEDPRYLNTSLARRPWRSWAEGGRAAR